MQIRQNLWGCNPKHLSQDTQHINNLVNTARSGPLPHATVAKRPRHVNNGCGAQCGAETNSLEMKAVISKRLYRTTNFTCTCILTLHSGEPIMSISCCNMQRVKSVGASLPTKGFNTIYLGTTSTVSLTSCCSVLIVAPLYKWPFPSRFSIQPG